MSTLEDLKSGLAHAWEGVTEGWREFTSRAGDALTRFNPIHHADDSRSSANALSRVGSRWGVLAAELHVGDDEVEVTLECPGMADDDFSIDVVGDVLVVRGEKHVESARDSGRYHVMERAYGRFERALRLPVDVDENEARASYERGVLRIRLPRAAHTRTRRIPVRAA